MAWSRLKLGAVTGRRATTRSEHHTTSHHTTLNELESTASLGWFFDWEDDP
jgi:hypothetical protein